MYAWRNLHPNKWNYGITELETLGLVWAAKLFRPYLLGRKCVVVHTDHSTCTSLSPLSKIGLLGHDCTRSDLEIKRRPGKGNTNADYLSRNPCDPTLGQAQVMQVDVAGNEKAPLISGVDTTELSAAGIKVLTHLFQYIEKGVLPEK